MQNHYTDWLYYFLFCLIDKKKICCILIKIAITKSFGFLTNLDLSENMKEIKKPPAVLSKTVEENLFSSRKMFDSH